jgi:hypothetical protein
MKNVLLSGLLILSVSCVSIFAYSSPRSQKKVLVISDIDDTIKVSNVLDTVGVVARSLNFTVPFAGMAELYQLIGLRKGITTKFIYVSNAPAEIFGYPLMSVSHGEFLSFNNFPKGELLLKESLDEQNHKIKSIRKITKSFKPDVVIMIGDNGELDTDIYAQAQKELNQLGIPSLTYIHQLYSSGISAFEYKQVFLPASIVLSSMNLGRKLLPGQFGFVTPIEIALDLKNKGLLHQTALNKMTQDILPQILNEDFFDIDTLGAVTFPSFKNCSDFKWTIQIPAELSALAAKIKQKCH